MRTLTHSKSEWIAVAGIILAILMLSFLLSSCHSKSGDHYRQVQAMEEAAAIKSASGTIPLVLVVIGRPDEHTVMLWQKNTAIQYTFRVENSFQTCFELGAEIYVERNKPE